MRARIALVGDFKNEVTAHHAIIRALEIAGEELEQAIEPVWTDTPRLRGNAKQELAACCGIWCVPGSPYVCTEGALDAIRFAREERRPFLGTCGGFQHALLEYARNLLGVREAEHVESSPERGLPLISPLRCRLVEKEGTIFLMPASRMREICRQDCIDEVYHCSFGLNPRYETLFDHSELHLSGRDKNGDVRAMELHGHPFFMATLFQPERHALNGESHPLIAAFVSAALRLFYESHSEISNSQST